MRIFDALKPLGLLLLRLGVGIVFLFHGYAKLFGSPAMWLKWFPQYGFPSYFAYLAGSLEFFGAILLILGLLTRVVGLLLAIQMAVAVVKVHIPATGLYNVGGYELPLLLGVASFALATVGAGLLSVDAATFERGGGGGSGKSRAKGRG